MLWLLLPVLSLLVLAAHFLRAGNAILVVVPLAILVGLLVVRRAWVARLAQVVLLLGAIEWLAALVDLAGERMHAGEPVRRLVAILGAVALVTAASALVFQTERLRAVYRVRRRAAR
jgi:hypothetical protein